MTTTMTTRMFGLSSFIAPTIVQFLGVRSLIRFGATCRCHNTVSLGEVERRRTCIVAVEAEVAKLVAAVPTRMNIITATKLVECTRRLIDDELDFHDKIGKRELIIDNDEYDWKEFDPFLQERKKFLPGSTGEREVGTLYVLPMCFYCPPEGESSNPSPEAIVEATTKAYKVWGAEDMMGYVIEVNCCDDDWDCLEYEQPLRKYSLNGADRFTEFAYEKACELVNEGLADAFRIAAREVFFKRPGARDCLWYTLEQVDLIVIEETKIPEEVDTSVLGTLVGMMRGEMRIIHQEMLFAFLRDCQDPVDFSKGTFPDEFRYDLLDANLACCDRFKSLMTEEKAAIVAGETFVTSLNQFFTDFRLAVRVSRYAFPAVLKEDQDGIRLARDNFHARIANEPIVVSLKQLYADIREAAEDQDQIKSLWDTFLASY